MSVNYLKGNTTRQINSDKKKKVVTVRASAHLRSSRSHVRLTEPLNSTRMLYEKARWTRETPVNLCYRLALNRASGTLVFRQDL